MAFVGGGLPARAGHPRIAQRSARRCARRATPPARACGPVPGALPAAQRARAVAALDVEAGAHVLRAAAGGVADADHVLVDGGEGVVALVDAGGGGAGAGALQMLRDALRPRRALYPDETTPGVAAAVADALRPLPPGASALAARAAAGVLRVAWAGPVGLLVVRGDAVAFRTYCRRAPRAALEHTLAAGGDGGGGGGQGGACVRGGEGRQVHTEFFPLECGDLVLAGSDGLFANLSEEQILAFVRPVPDPNDKTLAIANGTCLGSWRTDDVEFISYYLAHLAENFATARHAPPFLPFPFPPGPRVDDISVVALSCPFPV